MERSRRNRLSELYGGNASQPGTPAILRQRAARQQTHQHQQQQQQHHLQDHHSIKKEHTPKLPQRHTVQPQDPLIPPTILDIGSQRAFVLVLFAIIQSYKAYDLILFKNSLPVSAFLGLGFPSNHFNFITKYLVYDSAFLYFLPVLRIPSLRFRTPVVLLQIALMFLINVFLASDLSFPLTTVLLAAWKKLSTSDLTILGSKARTGSTIYDPSKHFKGSYTIKILPENTVQLNPFQDSFCLPYGASNYRINVPVRLNSSSEIELMQVQYTDFDTSTPIMLNYTKRDIKRFDIKNINDLYEKDHVAGPNIHYLNLPISKTGLYEIHQVMDSKHLGLRNYRSPLIVPYCPTAEIKNTDSLSQDKCKGDLYDVKFTIEGVPPLKLKYKKLINHDVQEFSDQSLQPESFHSPLNSHGGSRVFTKEQLKDLSWAKIRPVDVELANPVKELGDYSYRIEEIVDGLGNLVNFTESLKDNDDLFKQYNLLQSFYAHDLPKVHLNEKVNKNTATKRSLVLAVDQGADDAAPFHTEIQFISEDESESKTINHVFKNAYDEYKIEKPGTYTLRSVKSRFCPSVISGRTSVSVSLPVVPQLKINSKPITDSCVGQVGLVFDMSFVGTPPFNLEQQVFRINNNGQRQLQGTKKIHSPGTRYRFSFEPQQEGNYEIAFTKLMDSLYSDPIELSPATDYLYTTSMRVKPNAEVFNYHKNSLCLGSKGKIPIQFKGEAPFTLDYDVIDTSTNKRVPYTIKNISSNIFDLETIEFKTGGEYIVSLTSVEDSSSCLVNLNGADAKIAIRREVPSVGFGISESTKIKQGDKLDIPLRLLGEGSFQVEYDYFNPEGKFVSSHKALFKNAYKSELEVTQAGTYKLKSVKDSQCQGVVDSYDTYEVTYHTKPSLRVSEQPSISHIRDNVFEKKNVCQFYEDSIDLSITGSPPFAVDYTIISPDGKRSQYSISVATKFSSLRLLNDKGGEYKYIITGIYDSVYSKHDLEKIHYKIDPITIRQHVNPSPSGEFKHKRKSYRTCTTNLLEKNLLEPIKLNIQGKSPLSVTFEIFHESSSKSEFLTMNNIDASSDLKDLYRGLKLGNHVVSISKIVDADGCVQENFPESNYISIAITDTPKINQLDSSIDYCVGDHIGYQLIGSPPFTVVYSFNGLNLKSVEQSSQFVRLASEPGIINIESLQDSSSNCVVNFTLPEYRDQSERLSIQVHQIPSVELSQGDSIIQDIHEGDQAEIIFSFEGTPPFSLTYVRTEEVSPKRGKKRSEVVETHTVNDIYAYEYRVLTSLQGRYEAIEVSDAFCVARNE